MKVAVVGAGAWGTALARVLVEGGNEVTLWTWQNAHCEAMLAERENKEFLPGFALPAELSVTADLEKAAASAQLLLLVLPSHAVRNTMRQASRSLGDQVPVVVASKGIEDESLRLMSEVVQEELHCGPDRVCVLSGPSFAKEVARRVPTNLVAASSDSGLATRVQRLFALDWLRVYTSGDPVGVEIGGALKNVIAIAAGASDGLNMGANTRAALITRGIAEMSRFSAAKGGDRITAAGLAGIGDLVLTCTGDLSRNRTLGKKLGQGQTVHEALSSSEGVAEGYVTARSAWALSQKLVVDAPITQAVYSVLHAGTSMQQALTSLLERPLRGEWE